MRRTTRMTALVLGLALAVPAWAQTAVELKKELLPKIKKAQADGKDLGVAAKEYEEGDKAMKDGLQEEAVDHFKTSKAAMPADAKSRRARVLATGAHTSLDAACPASLGVRARGDHGHAQALDRGAPIFRGPMGPLPPGRVQAEARAEAASTRHPRRHGAERPQACGGLGRRLAPHRPAARRGGRGAPRDQPPGARARSRP